MAESSDGLGQRDQSPNLNENLSELDQNLKMTESRNGSSQGVPLELKEGEAVDESQESKDQSNETVSKNEDFSKENATVVSIETNFDLNEHFENDIDMFSPSSLEKEHGLLASVGRARLSLGAGASPALKLHKDKYLRDTLDLSQKFVSENVNDMKGKDINVVPLLDLKGNEIPPLQFKSNILDINGRPYTPLPQRVVNQRPRTKSLTDNDDFGHITGQDFHTKFDFVRNVHDKPKDINDVTDENDSEKDKNQKGFVGRDGFVESRGSVGSGGSVGTLPKLNTHTTIDTDTPHQALSNTTTSQQASSITTTSNSHTTPASMTSTNTPITCIAQTNTNTLSHTTQAQTNLTTPVTTPQQQGASALSWAARTTMGAQTESEESRWIQGTLQGLPSNIATDTNMSDLEVATLMVRKMQIPPHYIEAYDTSINKTLRIKFRRGIDPQKYMNTSAIMVRDNLKLLPMKEPTREMDVEIMWCSVDTPDQDIIATMELFGNVVSIRHATMSQEVNGQKHQILEDCKHIKKGNRIVKMLILRPIPSYIMIGTKRVKTKHEGQIQVCSRCYKWATGGDRCKGRGNARECQGNRGEERDFRDFWDELVGKMEGLKGRPNETVFYGTSTVEISNLDEDATKQEIVELLREVGVEINENQVGDTDFPRRKMILDLNEEQIGITIMRLDKRRFRNKLLRVESCIPLTPRNAPMTEEEIEQERIRKEKRRVEEARRKLEFEERQAKQKAKKEAKEKKDAEKAAKLAEVVAAEENERIRREAAEKEERMAQKAKEDEDNRKKMEEIKAREEARILNEQLAREDKIRREKEAKEQKEKKDREIAEKKRNEAKEKAARDEERKRKEAEEKAAEEAEKKKKEAQEKEERKLQERLAKEKAEEEERERIIAERERKAKLDREMADLIKQEVEEKKKLFEAKAAKEKEAKEQKRLEKIRKDEEKVKKELEKKKKQEENKQRQLNEAARKKAEREARQQERKASKQQKKVVNTQVAEDARSTPGKRKNKKKKNIIENIGEDTKTSGNVVIDRTSVGAEVEVATGATSANVAGDNAANKALNDPNDDIEVVKADLAGDDAANAAENAEAIALANACASPAITDWGDYMEDPEAYERRIEIDDMFDISGGKDSVTVCEIVIDDLIVDSIIESVKGPGEWKRLMDVHARETMKKRNAKDAEFTPPEDKAVEDSEEEEMPRRGAVPKKKFYFSTLNDEEDFISEDRDKKNRNDSKKKPAI